MLKTGALQRFGKFGIISCYGKFANVKMPEFILGLALTTNETLFFSCPWPASEETFVLSLEAA